MTLRSHLKQLAGGPSASRLESSPPANIGGREAAMVWPDLLGAGGSAAGVTGNASANIEMLPLARHAEQCTPSYSPAEAIHHVGHAQGAAVTSSDYLMVGIPLASYPNTNSRDRSLLSGVTLPPDVTPDLRFYTGYAAYPYNRFYQRFYAWPADLGEPEGAAVSVDLLEPHARNAIAPIGVGDTFGGSIFAWPYQYSGLGDLVQDAYQSGESFYTTLTSVAPYIGCAGEYDFSALQVFQDRGRVVGAAKPLLYFRSGGNAIVPVGYFQNPSYPSLAGIRFPINDELVQSDIAADGRSITAAWVVKEALDRGVYQANPTLHPSGRQSYMFSLATGERAALRMEIDNFDLDGLTGYVQAQNGERYWPHRILGLSVPTTSIEDLERFRVHAAVLGSAMARPFVAVEFIREGAAAVSTPKPDVERPSDPRVAQWLDLLNDFRAQNDLKPMRWNDGLARACRLHLYDLMDNEFYEMLAAWRNGTGALDQPWQSLSQSVPYHQLAHFGKDGSTPMERVSRCRVAMAATGENLTTGTEGFGETFEEALTEWINSPFGHRDLLVNPFVTHVGIGYVDTGLEGLSEKHGTPHARNMWALIFGMPAQIPESESGAQIYG